MLQMPLRPLHKTFNNIEKEAGTKVIMGLGIKGLSNKSSTRSLTL